MHGAGRAAWARIVDEEVAKAAEPGRGAVGPTPKGDLVNLGPKGLRGSP